MVCVVHARIRNSPVPAALLLEKEPTNMQALSLGQLIDKAVARGSSSFSACDYCNTSSFYRGLYWDGPGRWGSCGRDTNFSRSYTARCTQMTMLLIIAYLVFLPSIMASCISRVTF